MDQSSTNPQLTLPSVHPFNNLSMAPLLSQIAPMRSVTTSLSIHDSCNAQQQGLILPPLSQVGNLGDPVAPRGRSVWTSAACLTPSLREQVETPVHSEMFPSEQILETVDMCSSSSISSPTRSSQPIELPVNLSSSENGSESDSTLSDPDEHDNTQSSDDGQGDRPVTYRVLDSMETGSDRPDTCQPYAGSSDDGQSDEHLPEKFPNLQDFVSLQ